MRLSDLMKLEAVDRDGNKLGRVRDVRLERRDGDWVATAVILGSAAVAERLGFAYGVVERPALVARAMRRLQRHAKVAPWERLNFSEVGNLVVEARIDELGHPDEER